MKDFKLNINKILNLTNRYAFEVSKLNKTAQEAAVGKKVLEWSLKALPWVLPAVSKAVDEVRTGKSVIDDIDNIINFLNEYKKSYAEDYNKYNQQFEDFIKNARQLQELFNKIDSSPKGDNVLENIENYLSVSYEVQILAGAIRGYLDELKGLGGKAFDFVQSMGFHAGFQTLSTGAQKSIDELFKHLSMSTPVLQAKLDKLKSQITQAQNNQSKEPVGSAEPSDKTKEFEKPSEAESTEAEPAETMELSDEFKKQLEELGGV